MKTLLMVGLMAAALSSGTAMAKPANSKAAKVTVTRAEKTRRAIAFDLHRRGSNIPPAFSDNGRWSR